MATAHTLTGIVPSQARSWLATDASWLPTLNRIGLGLVMFPHGAQKLLGWFGGYGLSGTLGWLTGAVGLPLPVALLVVAAESLGALALLFGAGTRLAASGVLAVMLGAVATTHWSNGFFMNWEGTQAGEGFEFHLAVATLSLIHI